MPTAYTSPIYEGDYTLGEYALRCARAFSYFMHQRDESLENPPRPGYDGYYHERKKEVEAELADARGLSLEEWEAKAVEEHAADIASSASLRAEKKANAARLEAMLAKVRAWRPPSSHHDALREYMISQINLCLPMETYSDAEWDKYHKPKPQKSGVELRDLTIHELETEWTDLAKKVANAEFNKAEGQRFLEDLVKSIEDWPKSHG